jgi:uncharacterized phiE125 gp8 family phage protein
MSSILLTAPAVEPLTLAEAKEYLRVDTSDDDDVITALIAGARVHIEAQTRRALITQSWRLVRDCWPPDGRIAVRPAPPRSVVAARYYDEANATHAIDTSAFVVDTASSVLSFAAWSMPAPGRDAAGIEIDVSVGYGDAASAIPEALRQAIRMLIAHWYENRGLVALGETIAVMPATTAALIAPFRMLAL